MEAYASEWLQLLIRWVHLITGIAWIGASFYFVRLDLGLRAPKRREDEEAGVGGAGLFRGDFGDGRCGTSSFRLKWRGTVVAGKRGRRETG